MKRKRFAVVSLFSILLCGFFGLFYSNTDKIEKNEFLEPPRERVILKSIPDGSCFIKNFPEHVSDAVICNSRKNSFRWIHWKKGNVLNNEFVSKSEAKSILENALNKMPAWMFVVGEFKNSIDPETMPQMEIKKAKKLEEKYLDYLRDEEAGKKTENFNKSLYIEEFPEPPLNEN